MAKQADGTKPYRRKVVARATGTYPNDVLRIKGDVFFIAKEEHFSKNWMADAPSASRPTPEGKVGSELSDAVKLVREGTLGNGDEQEPADGESQDGI